MIPGPIVDRQMLVASGLFICMGLLATVAIDTVAEEISQPPRGVCPPYHLRSEDGEVIDPKQSPAKPYSPKQTCGVCHNYEKITSAYHFTQGFGEQPTRKQSERIGWATSPGNHGGNWCSPAALYPYLSAEQNDDRAEIDMTSYTFLASCGVCHPGGGSAEFDRQGRRYDRWAADPASGITDGGDNDLHGDYFQARWVASGVLEADCLICHLPDYDMAARNGQVRSLNYRWAATVGSGLGEVSGTVKDGDEPVTSYRETMFRPDGTLELPVVRSPPNESCLACHQQPGWKKRGANFRARTDVHLKAGMRCVDCHPSGSSASDPRISDYLNHGIAKGDDPGGLVHDHLDNTVRSCKDCHDTGARGGPIAKHAGLPPLHLERMECQTCHVPERLVKPISIQASALLNDAPRIPQDGKQLWTFYGPDGEWRNHYGFLNMMGYDHKPTEPFRPTLIRYQGTIRPANRVHSAWPGIEVENRSALLQPRMRDLRTMWLEHREDPTRYPSLAMIRDDDGDGVPEVDRPEEIDALIHAVTQRLEDVEFPMTGRRVVWVLNERVYRSGTEYREMDKETWEASPFANVHTYNHDIYPARAALGANGCTDCHSPGSDFFYAPVLNRPFDPDGGPAMTPQWSLLDPTPFWADLGAYREYYGKPVLYALLAGIGLSGLVLATVILIGRFRSDGPAWHLALPWGIAGGGGLVLFAISLHPEVAGYVFPSRAWLDSQHVLVAGIIYAIGGVLVLLYLRDPRSRSRASWILGAWCLFGLLLAGFGGTVMLFGFTTFGSLSRLSYTLFDIGLMVAALGICGVLLAEATACCRAALQATGAKSVGGICN